MADSGGRMSDLRGQQAGAKCSSEQPKETPKMFAAHSDCQVLRKSSELNTAH